MSELGQLPPCVSAPLPGAKSRQLVDQLAQAECPAFTARRKRRAEESGTDQDPIVWHQARGANVVDVDGNRYVDFTAGFGVAAVGHRHPAVVGAITRQADTLLHALGDLHPSDTKIQLLDRLAALAPWDARVVLSQNGADAVETALKTAMLVTRKAGILAFEGGYHGLAHGPLAACGYSVAFRRPFADQLNPHVHFAAFGEDPGPLPSDVGAILVEPIQGRGGVVVPPPSFLATLRRRADEAGAVLIVDEIFTGLGRAGAHFLSGDLADVLCIGKALGGGMPISACLGRAPLMAYWAGDPDHPQVGGEAIHTGTFYGHPLGCAAALATLDVLKEEELAARAEQTGLRFRDALGALDGVTEVRGQSLMIGVCFEDQALQGAGHPGGNVLGLVAELLHRGYLTLPAGARAEVLQLVPPLNIAEHLLEGFVATLQDLLQNRR